MMQVTLQVQNLSSMVVLLPYNSFKFQKTPRDHFNDLEGDYHDLNYITSDFV